MGVSAVSAARSVMRYLFFDVSSGRGWVEEVPLGDGVLGPIDYGLELHYRYESFRLPPLSPRSPFVVGRGVFAGGRVFGSHRLVAVFRSPLSRGFHVSAIGGAAYSFARTGLHGVVVVGWSEEPGVIAVRFAGGRLEAWWDEVGWDTLWEVWRGYRGLRGVPGFTRWLVDRYWEGVLSLGGRSIVVGPAAARTLAGGLFSIGLRGRGELDPAAFDSAARGGGGTVLLRGHGVAGIVFGGEDWPERSNPRLGDLGLLDRVARKVTGKGYSELVRQATVKYRYDPRLGTGGTFGVNYVHYRGLVPFLGYNSVYLSKLARERLVEAVLERLWAPVQREVFESPGRKPWGTCGEPCPAVCKKVWRGVKIDYEPSNAMGPFIGVFSAEETRELIRLVDELGLDAIEAGHIVAWVFDLVSRGMLQPGEAGLSSRPLFDPVGFDPEEASRVNARLARELLEALVEHRGWLPTLIASRGLRAAAHALNLRFAGRVQLHHTGYHDAAVYAAFGEEGYMTPNYYWSPGVVAPVPVLGRYWTVYSPSFSEPEAMAEAAVERAVAEYLVDNAGLCRFHRKWAERLLEHLYREIWGVDVDLRGHGIEKLRLILRYQELAGAEPRPWESRKTVDMVASIAAEMDAAEWAERLASEPGAAVEWWSRFYRRVRLLLGLGESSGGKVEAHG